MQKASRVSVNGNSERIPWSLMMTTSPGSMSRTKDAPIRSKAQVSEERTHPSSSLPSERGRRPLGSRKPMISFSPMTTAEKAPSRRRSAPIGPPIVSSGWARRWRMISLSTVVWKIEPRVSSSWRREAALTKLPLWATAICPRAVSTESGCELSRVLEPVVE